MHKTIQLCYSLLRLFHFLHSNSIPSRFPLLVLKIIIIIIFEKLELVNTSNKPLLCNSGVTLCWNWWQTIFMINSVEHKNAIKFSFFKGQIQGQRSTGIPNWLKFYFFCLKFTVTFENQIIKIEVMGYYLLAIWRIDQ